MITADGFRIVPSQTVFSRVGGEYRGQYRVSELRVVRLTKTRVRCERVNGRLGCWRRPGQLFMHRHLAKDIAIPEGQEECNQF